MKMRACDKTDFGQVIKKGWICLLAILCLLGAGSFAHAATPYPLNIVQPRAGLDIKHRFYKAYPGLAYNVRAGVTGGIYPYQHILTVAPPGMTIDSFTGEVNWPSPTTTASPHAVTLKVTDQEGTSTTVSWTITVTTSGFRFLDAVDGKTVANGGTGAINNPWKTIADMYEGADYAASNIATYKNEFLYFKNGTYSTFTMSADSTFITLTGNVKPIVWMAYPGEVPRIDAENAGLWFQINGYSAYFEGFELIRAHGNAVNLRGSEPGSNSIVRKNTLHDFPMPSNHNANSAVIFADSPNSVIQDNEFYDVALEHGIIGFDGARMVLIENNLFHDFSASYTWVWHSAVTTKSGNQMWFIRGNRMYNLSGKGIYLMYMNNGNMRDIEVSYNIISNQIPSSFPNSSFYTNPAYVAGLLYVHHNTFIGNVVVSSMQYMTDGPFYFYNNTIVNTTPGDPAGSHIKLDTAIDQARVVQTDNLAGYPADGIVDINQTSPTLGNLASANLGHIGLHGHQLAGADQAAPPQPPADTSSYALTILKSGTGSGTVTASEAGINCNSSNTDCSETYAASTTIVLTAVPSATSTFDGWIEGCLNINPCQTLMNKTRQITAVFKAVPATAPYPLTIVQPPRAGLDVGHRFYKAYPGFVYNVRAGVTGGVYPYQHVLTAAPPGMTINSFTGEINWSNPATVASPHAVTLRVTDQAGTVTTVSWTITVTTSGFRFMDAVNGKTVANGGTGTINNPWKTIEDMYEGPAGTADYKYSYKNEFLYFRNGTYQVAPEIYINGSFKPIVWMAYPGESPAIDATGSLLWFRMSGYSGYLEGFEFAKAGAIALRLQGDVPGSNIIIRKNTFHDLTSTSQTTTTAIWAASPGLIQDNHFYNIALHHAIFGTADGDGVLVENNLFHDFPAPSGWFNSDVINVFSSCEMWFIRGNRMYNLSGRGIVIAYESDPTRDVEVSYNVVSNQTPGATNLSFYALPQGHAGPLYVHHNTFIGNAMFYMMYNTDGPFYFYNNTIVNASLGTPAGSHITLDTVADPTRVNQTENLAGYPADGIVDIDEASPTLGNLTPAYALHVGLRGHQINLNAPASPKNLIVQ